MDTDTTWLIVCGVFVCVLIIAGVINYCVDAVSAAAEQVVVTDNVGD